MPSADQHRNKAERNRKFVNSIVLDEFPDWVAVAAFYTAVHRIKQYRAFVGDGDSTSHEDRLNYVQHRLPIAIHSEYHVLQNVRCLPATNQLPISSLSFKQRMFARKSSRPVLPKSRITFKMPPQYSRIL